MNQNRVPEGVPTGGQYAATPKPDADVALATTAATAEEWLPPGAHRVVPCERCDAAGCDFCDRGQVTCDRYGQVPWYPDAPGTELAFEDPRTGEWRSATITATTREGLSEYFAVAELTDGETRDVYLLAALPPHAAQAAARHEVNTHELIAEAASEMHIGIEPTHDEVRAFLARIDEGYCEDIARSAHEYRRHHAAELRREGRTGPPLDHTVDPATLDSAAIDRAVATVAPGGEYFKSMTHVVRRDHWHGYTIVATPSGRIATYKDTAWDRPEETPMLPWSPPEGTPVAHVAVDGTVTRVDETSPGA